MGAGEDTAETGPSAHRIVGVANISYPARSIPAVRDSVICCSEKDSTRSCGAVATILVPVSGLVWKMVWIAHENDSFNGLSLGTAWGERLKNFVGNLDRGR